MSPRTAAAIAARTRRTPHGKGRFDPSEPLHMTTRHAARNGKTNGTPSPNGSVDDDDSFRGSFDEINVMSSQSLGSPNSTKGRRMSLTSANGASAANSSFESKSFIDQIREYNQQKPLSPVLQSPSPSRKRKRSTPTPPESLNGVDNSLANSVAEMMEQDPRDFVEVVHPDDLSDREESDGSVESEEQFAGDFLGATQSTENTPAATPLGSQAVSPVSEESNPDAYFLTKLVSVAKAEVMKPVEPDDVDDVEVEDAEELVEADEVDDVEGADDGDDQVREVIDGQPRRRLAGRRRAEHHDPKVEATMRRQLQLKSTFRAIARALKPVLAEIAQKTVENLEEEPHLHEQVVEYRGTEEEEGIQQLLDDALARRKAQLEAQFRWNKLNLQKTLQGEDKVRRSRCELQIADLRDLQFDRLEHDLLTVARNAQKTSGDIGHETDDESDDVVLRPHATDYRYKRTGTLDSKYDSRSRLTLESERAIADLQTRFDMFKMLKAVRPEDKPGGMRFFATMDNTAREAAEARRESVMNMKMLAEAAAEKERIDQTPVMPVVPNEQAIGLQVLGDVAGQFGKAAGPPATPPPPPRMTPPPTQMPPPPQSNRLPVSFEGLAHDMSPRATTFSDRPGPPPASPLHPSPARERAPSQSPRKEPMILSPMFQADRGKTLPPFNMQPRDAEHELRHESLPPPPPPVHQTRDVFGRDRSHRDIFGREIMNPEGGELPHLGAQLKDEPTWNQYHGSLNVDRSPKPPSQPDRSIHEFSQGGPLRIERVETTEPERQHLRHLSNDRPFMVEPALSGPFHTKQRSLDRPADLASMRPRQQETRGAPSYTSPRMAPMLGRAPFQETRGPVHQGSFLLDPALGGPPPHEGREPTRRPSPPLETALNQPRFVDERIPSYYEPSMIDPALSRPPIREESGSRHLESLLIDPALRRAPQPLLRGTINQDSSMIDPALTRPLLQEEYRPLSHASPPLQPAQAKAPHPWEAPSSPGAADSRERSEPSPLLAPRDMVVDELSRKPRSRASSTMSQSTTTEASPDVSVAGEPTKRRSSGKPVYSMKASKGDRKGNTRRIWKEHHPSSSRKSQNSKPEIHRFRLNSVESTPTAPWSNPSNKTTTRTPSDPFTTQPSYGGPPNIAHAQSGHPLPPPPPGTYSYAHPYDHAPSMQHRNSFPQPESPWLPSQQPPQSPLHAVPPSTQPPPAPPAQSQPQPQPGGGPPPDQWPSPSVFAPTLFRPSQQTPRNNSQPAQPPPLAPATPDVHRTLASGGPTTNHLPAFAQQQRNQEANPRRRAHSEIQGHSFKHWAPRNVK
ncbi:hypothetical protein M409DRAFT_21488 [Zasmidium cellare ATCC 36951]|uniref:Uncharacterized protein n=1 Tax=Zasmidium cellare ATCC 36951 TaxID=1080233 RepID=A0A6A6CQE3_ZASCE|nr:uncharacterized protein M409DRAFT_21488 [Zasmidium cellare ATCC 36951]KAF2168042.1 hypothetical protein M409DRAFT_21488 [Zasmidium cellare ATCC 36951]